MYKWFKSPGNSLCITYRVNFGEIDRVLSNLRDYECCLSLMHCHGILEERTSTAEEQRYSWLFGGRSWHFPINWGINGNGLMVVHLVGSNGNYKPIISKLEYPTGVYYPFCHIISATGIVDGKDWKWSARQ